MNVWDVLLLAALVLSIIELYRTKLLSFVAWAMIIIVIFLVVRFNVIHG